MNPELKECPFCPEGIGVYMHTTNDWYWVACDSCNAETNGAKTIEEAAKQWNDRSSTAVPALTADEVEAICCGAIVGHGLKIVKCKCGSSAHCSQASDGYYRVGCNDIDCTEGVSSKISLEEAVNLWNMRMSEPMDADPKRWGWGVSEFDVDVGTCTECKEEEVTKLVSWFGPYNIAVIRCNICHNTAEGIDTHGDDDAAVKMALDLWNEGREDDEVVE